MPAGISRIKHHDTDKNHYVRVSIYYRVKERSEPGFSSPQTSDPAVQHIKQIGEDHQESRRKEPAISVKEGAANVYQQSDKRKDIRVYAAASQRPH
jgi:hypothetical protein